MQTQGGIFIPISVPAPITTPVTLQLTNKLVYPVNVSVNGTFLTAVPASTTVQQGITVTGSLSVSFALVRPTLAGVPLGDPMSGVFNTISSPAGTISFTINNIIGTQWYFAPYITNQTSSGLLMDVNAGLTAENRCNCVAPAGVSNVAIGYYQLFSNSNVRAYLSGSGYTGSYLNWTNFVSNVATDSGILRLTATTAP
jgi:hypothetical protein